MTSGGQICPLGGQFEGLGPQIRDPDPDFDLREAKICGPKTDFPSGGANFDLWRGQNPVDLANFGVRRSPKANFRDPSLEKVAEFWPRMGIGSPFLDPEGSANPEGPKMRPKFNSNVGLKTSFSQIPG